MSKILMATMLLAMGSWTLVAADCHPSRWARPHLEDDASP